MRKMKTDVKKVGDTLIVSLEGNLDFEIQEPLKNNLQKLAKRASTDEVPKKIIFNLENLQFVGSSGISSFVESLCQFNRLAPVPPRYVNVKSEFRKIIEAFDNDEEFLFFDCEDRARKSFDQ